MRKAREQVGFRGAPRVIFTAGAMLAAAACASTSQETSAPHPPPTAPAPAPAETTTEGAADGSYGDDAARDIAGFEDQGAASAVGFIPAVYFSEQPASPCHPANQLPMGADETSDEGYTCLQIFFGTNRDVRDEHRATLTDPATYPANPDQFFADTRIPLAPPTGPYFRRKDPVTDIHPPYETYRHGRAFVTVPKREPGERLRGYDYKKFLFFDAKPTDRDRKNLFTVQRYEFLDERDFWGLARDMKNLGFQFVDSEPGWVDDAGAVMVYVHGFNASLTGAAYRTAQLAYDLKFAGVPMFFSWPANSENNPLLYFNDVSEGAGSVGDLKLFLRDVRDRLEPTKMIVIAHSHGNQVLLNALNEMTAEDASTAGMIDAVIFASPDVDAVEFKRVAERVGPIARSKTLYTSSNDRANWFRAALTSVDWNPFNDPLKDAKPRAGFFKPGENPLVVDGVNTIDVTNACVGPLGVDEDSDDEDKLKHAKYADARDLVADMRRLFSSLNIAPMRAPHERFEQMRAIPSPSDPSYWRFVAESGVSRNCG